MMTTQLVSTLGQSAEDYLKAIFKLQQADGAVSTSSLACTLAVSPAAATKAVQLLAAKKLIHYRPYHGVTLTEKGRKAALKIVRHHRLLELFLHDVLGYSWDEVDAEAERLEHHISDEFVARIDRLMNYPQLDPHGDPIPTRDGTLAKCSGRALADCHPQERVVIDRVRDKDPRILQFLGQMGVRPGVVIEIVARQPFNGPLTLRIGSEDHAVGCELAGNVFVRRAEDEGQDAGPQESRVP